MTRKKAPKRVGPATPKKDEQRSSLLSTARLRLLAGLLIVVVIAAAIWFFVAHRRDTNQSVPNATKINASYVDNQTCAECHQKEFQD